MALMPNSSATRRALRAAPLLVAWLSLGACGGGSEAPKGLRGDAPPTVAIPSAAKASAKAAAERQSEAAGKAREGVRAQADAGGPPDLDDLKPYFATPALGEARAAYLRGANAAAAEGFEAAAADEATHGAEVARAARFMGLLSRHDAGECAETSGALERFASTWPELRDYARFYAASCRFKAGEFGQAARLAKGVEAGSTLHGRAIELTARAQWRLRDPEAAFETLEARLEAAPRSREEAWGLYVELAKLAKDGARTAKGRVGLATHFPTRPLGRAAWRKLGRKGQAALTPTDWLRRGTGLYRAHRHDEALDALNRAAEGFPRASEPRCEALVRIARTYDKKKQGAKAWKVWDRALGCSGDELADATFKGGMNRFRKGDDLTARTLLERHVAEFPGRSTADDALVTLAQIARRAGRKGEADGRLLDQLAAHPNGDQADEASWQLMWPRVKGRDWRGVVRQADALLERIPRETHYRAEGRTRYWRGRALAKLGQTDEAVADWTRVVREYPLSWYALLAFARLEQVDGAKAKAALADILAAADPPDSPLGPLPEAMWADPHVKAGVALARMGLVDSARRELAAAKAPKGTDAREIWAWAKAALFTSVGAPHRTVRLARREEPRFGAHWPVGEHRRLWELAHPRPYRDHVEKWATARGIDPHWVWAIMREESGFNPGVESWANAIGLMQIILPTAEFLAKGTDIDVSRAALRRPAVAVELGSKYLARLFDRHGQMPLASAGYNAGGGAVAKWRKRFGHLELDEFVETIPYREARGYVKRVTRSLARYTWLYGGEQLFRVRLAPPGRP